MIERWQAWPWDRQFMVTCELFHTDGRVARKIGVDPIRDCTSFLCARRVPAWGELAHHVRMMQADMRRLRAIYKVA